MATQTGSIDLTATNGVHLYAKGGFESAAESYATKSELSIEAGEILSTVSSTYATKQELDDLEIGGRNLLRWTADASGHIATNPHTDAGHGWVAQSGGNGVGTIAEVNDSPVYGVTHSFRITGNTSGNRDWQQRVEDFAVTGADGEWVFSAYARAIGSSCTYLVRVWSGVQNFNKNGTIGTGWTRLEIPVTLTSTIGPASGSDSPCMLFGLTGAGSIEYIAPKLERGNKATDWEPAPEDLESRVTQAETNIIQSAEAIVLNAKKSESASNMLLDWDAGTLSKVNAFYDRYWSDASVTAVTPSFVELADPPAPGIAHAAQFTGSGANTSAAGRALAFYNSTANVIPLTNGQSYVASWWARKTSGSGKTRLHCSKGGGGILSSGDYDLTSEWQHFTFRFTSNGANSDYTRMWFYARFDANTAGTVQICGFKLVPQEYASQAELKVQSDRIGMVVSNSDASSSLQLTADAMQYIGGHVEITDDAGTSTVISGGKLHADAISIGDLSGSIGGTNMLTDSDAPSMTKVYGVYDRYLSDSGQSSYVTGEFFKVTDPPVAGITNGYRISCTNAGGSTQRGYAWQADNLSTDIKIVPGETYTLSCYVRKVSGTPYINQRYAYSIDNRATWSYIPSSWAELTSTSWKQISYTFTYGADVTNRGPLYPIQLRSNSVGVIEACGFKFEKGNRATDWTPSPKDEAGRANVNIGGRNLLRGSGNLVASAGDIGTIDGTRSTSVSYGNAGASIYASDAWRGPRLKIGQALTRDGAKVGDTVTLSIMVMQNSGSTVTSPWIYLYRATAASNTPNLNGSGSINVSFQMESGVWYRMWCTFDVTAYSLTIDTTRFEAAQSASYNLYWSAPQLERGNRPSDWSPAPEDVAATATNYITADSSGIKVHDVGETSNYQHLTSSGTEIYQGGTSVAKFGSTARVGSASGQNMVTDGTGISLRSGTTDKLRLDSTGDVWVYGANGKATYMGTDAEFSQPGFQAQSTSAEAEMRLVSSGTETQFVGSVGADKEAYFYARPFNNHSGKVYAFFGASTASALSNGITIGSDGSVSLGGNEAEWRSALEIAEIINDQHSLVNVSSGSWAQLASVSLSAGRWIVLAGCYVEGFSNSGSRQFKITNETSVSNPSLGTSWVIPGSSLSFYGVLPVLVQPSSTTTYRTFGYQSSGAPLDMRVFMWAIRLR